MAGRARGREGLGSLAGALVIASRRGFIPHRRIFAAAVIVDAAALDRLRRLALALALHRPPALIGAAESGFATMQSTLVLLSAHEDRRGGAMGILSACIGTQPLGTLWLGLLATGIGVAAAMALNSFLALAAICPWPWRCGGGVRDAQSKRTARLSRRSCTPPLPVVTRDVSCDVTPGRP
jgi:hypothetical protein